MQFIRSDWETAVDAVASRLNDELTQGRRVLWLISGGSQTTANVQIMNQIPEELSRNLTVMPVDERYGPAGHKDSNWQQLIDAGFRPKQATAIPVLKDGLDFGQNVDYYRAMIEKAFDSSDIIIGQLGIGPDGHTAGILPHSAACDEAHALVVGYEAPPLLRLTTTFPALKKLTSAYALAFGNSKREALLHLQKEDLPLSEQPAQILKEIPEAYVYNDRVGGN